MDKKERLLFYQTIYYKEFERRDRITSRIFWSFSFVSVLLGALSYVLKNIHKVQLDIWGFLFGISLCTTLVALTISVIFLIIAFSKYTYGYLPNSRKIENHWTVLEVYYENEGGGTARNDFLTELIDNFCLLNDNNFRNNTKRTKYVHNASKGINVAIFSLAFTFVFTNVDITQKVYCCVSNPITYVINNISNKGKEVSKDAKRPKSAESSTKSKTSTTTSAMDSGKRGFKTTTSTTSTTSKTTRTTGTIER